MFVQTGKTFIVTLLAIVVALGGVAWLSSEGRKDAPTALAQTSQATQPSPQQPGSAYETSSTDQATGSGRSGYEEGYRAGYRDGHQDCSITSRSSVRRTYYRAPRTRVAGARYYNESRRGHSTRNMILTIAGPAAVGAGIGAIAKGGKGAGVGALLGGGGGALYYLLKHRRD
ncbi:MAG TPA: hypothetical protein VLM38_19775 [Blastocatellia bacterium]|nr:hypothetical protein [Blastocatellia bacterium]